MANLRSTHCSRIKPAVILSEAKELTLNSSFDASVILARVVVGL